jgi:hypothetical protein
MQAFSIAFLDRAHSYKRFLLDHARLSFSYNFIYIQLEGTR